MDMEEDPTPQAAEAATAEEEEMEKVEEEV